jgi:hypothetical protein
MKSSLLCGQPGSTSEIQHQLEGQECANKLPGKGHYISQGVVVMHMEQWCRMKSPVLNVRLHGEKQVS